MKTRDTLKTLNELDKNKKFFIIKKRKFLGTKTYAIHDSNMYDLTTAVKKLLALDTLNEDRENNSYHLQEVNFSMVEEPLVLTDEVKNTDQEELPF
jgi:hypothetical protein